MAFQLLPHYPREGGAKWQLIGIGSDEGSSFYINIGKNSTISMRFVKGDQETAIQVDARSQEIKVDSGQFDPQFDVSN